MRTIKYLTLLLAVAVCALLLGANPRDRAKTGYRGRLAKSLTGRQSASSTPQVPSYVDSANTTLALDFHALAGLWKEPGGDGTPETNCSADGDAIGEAADFGPLCNEVVTTTGRLPILGSGSTRRNYATFDGVNDQMYVANSKKSFTTFHCSERVGTIAVCAYISANATAVQLLDNSNAAAAGIYLWRDTSNKVRLRITKTGPTTALDFTSTATVTAADGFVTLIFTFDGAGNGSFYKNGAAPETCNYSTTGDTSGTASAQLLYIGAQQSGTNYLVGSIASVHLSKAAWNATQRAEFDGWNPNRSTAQLVRKKGSDGLPTDYSMLRDWYDGQGTTYFYTGLLRATSVTANDDQVRTWANRISIDRDMQGSGGAGTYPKYKTAEGPIAGGIKFDGTDDNLAFPAWSRSGNWHAFVVIRNDDTTNGSHVFSESGGYLAVVSTNYASPPYAVIHSTTGYSGTGAYLVTPTGFNVIEVAKYDRKLWVRVNGVGALSGGSTLSAPVTAYTNMGTEIIAGWQLHGHVYALVHYSTNLPRGYADRVAAYLGTTYGVTGMAVVSSMPRRWQSQQFVSLEQKPRQAADDFFYALAP